MRSESDLKVIKGRRVVLHEEEKTRRKRVGEGGEAVQERAEGNSSGAGRKDVAREKKTLSPPIHRRIASHARKA